MISMEKTSASFFKPWSQLKQDPHQLYIENARTKMELPSMIPNPFPEEFGFEDYTNDAIQDIQKRGRYLTMDELENLSPPTQEMQEAIKEILKPGRAGGMLGAPAGFGKSYNFKYLGIMAAERSLSHSFLWFRGGSLTQPAQLKNGSQIQEYHFMFTDAKNLSQTGGYLGGATEKMRKLTQAVTQNSGVFVLALDEIYTALSTEHDAAGGWYTLKGLTQPDIHCKIIGTMAEKDIESFKKLKISPMTSGTDHQQGANARPIYDEQMKTRFNFVTVPDFTTEEQIETLTKGGLNSITHSKEISLEYDPKDKMEIINNLVRKTDEIELGRATKEWGAPRKWNAILSDANSAVTDRQETFAKYIADFDFLKKSNDLERWYKALAGVEREKKVIEQSVDVPEEQTQPSTPSDGGVGIVSLRDMGDKFPHEEVESHEGISQQKKERLNDLQDKETELKEGIQKLKRKRTIIEMSAKQGINELESRYGQGTFAEDMHDIGYLKPIDIVNLDISRLRFEDKQ